MFSTVLTNDLNLQSQFNMCPRTRTAYIPNGSTRILHDNSWTKKPCLKIVALFKAECLSDAQKSCSSRNSKVILKGFQKIVTILFWVSIFLRCLWTVLCFPSFFVSDVRKCIFVKLFIFATYLCWILCILRYNRALWFSARKVKKMETITCTPCWLFQIVNSLKSSHYMRT